MLKNRKPNKMKLQIGSYFLYPTLTISHWKIDQHNGTKQTTPRDINRHPKKTFPIANKCVYSTRNIDQPNKPF